MFSTTKCPACQKYGFEVVTEEPKDSNFKLMIVRCQSCKTAIGAMDFYNIGTLIHELAKKLNVDLDR